MALIYYYLFIHLIFCNTILSLHFCVDHKSELFSNLEIILKLCETDVKAYPIKCQNFLSLSLLSKRFSKRLFLHYISVCILSNIKTIMKSSLQACGSLYTFLDKYMVFHFIIICMRHI